MGRLEKLGPVLKESFTKLSIHVFHGNYQDSFCEHLEDKLPSQGPSYFSGDAADGIKNKSITVNNASYDELYWWTLSNLPVRGKFSTGSTAYPLCRTQLSHIKLNVLQQKTSGMAFPAEHHTGGCRL